MSTITHRQVSAPDGHSTSNGIDVNGRSTNGVPTKSSSNDRLIGQYDAFGVKEGHVTWGRWFLTLFGMVFVLAVIYWCWICTEYNKGEMILPYNLMYYIFPDSSFETTLGKDRISTPNWESWVKFMQSHLHRAIPSWYAWKVYLLWTAWQAFLFKVGPGHEQYGVELKDHTRLKYKFNGQFAFFTTCIVAAYLHLSGLWRLTELCDLFPEMLSVCIIWCSLVIGAIHFCALVTGTVENQTDSILYDYFMGAQLNPHILKGTIFSFDIKWFFELRPGIMHWFFTTIAFACRQYDVEGKVSWAMLAVCFYHLCFVNACYKGEHCVPWTIDIIHEKFGWMLCMLDIVMVPFVFPLQTYYVYKLGLFDQNPYYTLILFTIHCIGYYIFDTANSQKDYFREKPEEAVPSGFPRMPWGRLTNPRYIQTERGTKLLVDGWWAWARHCNYLGDILMSWSWGLTCGIHSYFPFAYTTYLTPLLIHREIRDDIVCAEKYRQDWVKYKKLVPYRICPYVY